jgi:hypothetical protein
MIDQIERGHTQPIQSSNYLQSSQAKLYNPDFSTTQMQQHQIKPSMFDPPRQILPEHFEFKRELRHKTVGKPAPEGCGEAG